MTTQAQQPTLETASASVLQMYLKGAVLVIDYLKKTDKQQEIPAWESYRNRLQTRLDILKGN